MLNNISPNGLEEATCVNIQLLILGSSGGGLTGYGAGGRGGITVLLVWEGAGTEQGRRDILRKTLALGEFRYATGLSES